MTAATDLCANCGHHRVAHRFDGAPHNCTAEVTVPSVGVPLVGPFYPGYEYRCQCRDWAEVELRTRSGRVLTDADVEQLAEEACWQRQHETGEPCEVHPLPKEGQ